MLEKVEAFSLEEKRNWIFNYMRQSRMKII